MLRKLLLVAPLALALSYATPASADSLAFDGVGKGVGGVNIGGSVLTINNVFAGELDWSWLTAPPAGFAANIYSYCVDVLHDVTNPEAVTVLSTDQLTPITSPSTVAGAGDKVAWLFNTYAAQIHASGTNAQAAGLQIAIWEALYDTAANLSGGNILFTGLSSSVIYAANTYLQALYAADYSSASAVWLDSPTGQDQVTNVPEPATLSLMALGLGSLLHARRRKTATGAAA